MGTKTASSAELLEIMRKDNRAVGKGCGYGKWLDGQNASVKEALNLAAEDPEITSVAIWRFAASQGCPVGGTAIRTHMSRQCACHRASK